MRSKTSNSQSSAQPSSGQVNGRMTSESQVRPAPSTALQGEGVFGTGLEFKDTLLKAGSLASAARALGRSSIAILRYCKLSIGQTPGRLIREARLIEAARVLVMGQKDILSVALDHGYNSQAAFSRAFSKCFGATPAALKRAFLAAQDAITEAGPVPFRKAHLPELKGISIEYIGDYAKIQGAIEELYRWAHKKGLLTQGHISASIIYQGHPWIFEAAKLKALIVLPILHDGEPSKGILPVTIPSGPVYEYTHKGRYDEVKTTYDSLLKSLRKRGSPCFCHEAGIITFGTHARGKDTTCDNVEMQESLVRIRVCDHC